MFLKLGKCSTGEDKDVEDGKAFAIYALRVKMLKYFFGEALYTDLYCTKVAAK
jgi:hypothetical protein